MPKAKDLEDHDEFDTAKYAQILEKTFKTPKNATYAWVGFVATYWTLLVILPAIAREDLGSYSFALWWLGMIGVCSVYYATQAGYPATSSKGKPIMAFANLMVSGHWSAIAFDALDGDLKPENIVLMLLHSITIFWSSLFFYETALLSNNKLAWMTLILEWVDLIFMGIAISVLSGNNDSCVNSVVCMGYFVVLIIHLLVWFLPIMFSMTDSPRSLHIHMIVLDSITDLPVVIIIMATAGYKKHWFLFIDVSYKIILLIRSYGYHGLYHLLLGGSPAKDNTKKQTENQQENQENNENV